MIGVPRRSGRGVTLLVSLLLLGGCGASAGPGTPGQSRAAADLTNPRLSIERSQWLVGAVAWLATDEEIAAYLALADDAAAAAFQEAFWAQRDPDPARPGNPFLDLFEQRSREADKRFSEAGYLGRRTDRGTLLVLQGEPTSIEFELNPRPDQPPLEAWTYEADEERITLTGRPPLPVYRFIKVGDLTTLFRHRVDPLARNRLPPAGIP